MKRTKFPLNRFPYKFGPYVFKVYRDKEGKVTLEYCPTGEETEIHKGEELITGLMAVDLDAS
jgi:hypothetical protein